MRSFILRHRVVSFVVGIFVVLGAIGMPYALKLYEAALVLTDVAAGAAPSAFKQGRPEPRRVPVAWTIEGRAAHGDLYVPVTGARARLVLVPGLAALGKDDPRLIAFANTLGRAGFLVLVPEIENLRNFRASPDDAVTLADAALFLSRDYDAGPVPRTAGFAALSYASGPAVLAALDPRIAETTPFILSIGGYFSMNNVITFVTTRKFRDHDGEAWREGNPASYATWAFLRANAVGVDDPYDVDLLTRIADDKLADDNADITAWVERLGPGGQSVYRLMINRDPDAVPALVAALPPRIQDGLARLDLSRLDLSGLSAELILIHGRDDPMIPSTESRKLAAAAPNVTLCIVDEVTHVEFNGASDLFDAINMVLAVRAMLSFRD